MSRVRRGFLIGLIAACAALGAAHDAQAAPAPTRWCGGDETATDRRPDAVASYQLHVVYAIPSDGTDRFFERALPIVRDLAAIDTWWRQQDPTRTLRWDLQAFPGCDTAFGALDMSVLRLPQPGATYAQFDNGSYSALVGDLLGAFTDPYKKYAVYYDGPVATGLNLCGVSSFGPIDRGSSFAFTLLNGDPVGTGCGTIGAGDYMSQTAVHEIVHNLGAVAPSAPHSCENGHVCDNPLDLMGSSGPSNSLFDYALDLGHDDYYGHSGSWWDAQDSAWLSHLDVPQFPLTVTASGTGKGSVASFLPGIACPPACSIAWDGGSAVSLAATPEGDRSRFAGWGGPCSGDADCLVAMDAAKTVTAEFRGQSSVAVSIARKGGDGRVTSQTAIDCPTGACESLFDTGAEVVLTALPDRRSRLAGWSIPSCAARLTCRLTAGPDKTVAATFSPGFYRLTALVTGSGRVRSAPAGLSCTRTCSASFAYAKPVRLIAAPQKGWRFAGWSGDCHGIARCVVTVTKTAVVRATFRHV